MANYFNIFDTSKQKIRTLHLTWIAFFITFFIWFNHAPLRDAIIQTFNLSSAEWKALLILNVALTIPARIVIGILVDRFGPRHTYSALLLISSFLCFFFAFAQTSETLMVARFLMGFVGAGFVIGIRMTAEWFPHREIGLAEGIYGGWGNFGSAAAAFALPTISLIFGGWRYAVATTGVIALIYSYVFFRFAKNTPDGSTYFSPKNSGAMEVTSKGDFVLYMLMNIPMYAALAVLTWKLGPANLDMISRPLELGSYIGLTSLYVYQLYQMFRVNMKVFRSEVPEVDQYRFSQVAILEIAYFVTFGSELAVVSMLPGFFIDTFSMEPVMAGLVAGGFAFMNLVARPGGGLFSDRLGRKYSLMILLLGLFVGYYLMSKIGSEWWIPVAVATTMFCSLFVQAGEGAVFAIVPLIKRRLTGQIAGMVGAYGNVGAVTFLTVFSFVDAQTFFLVITGAALVTLVCVGVFMREPQGQISETLPDGTVQQIDVS